MIYPIIELTQEQFDKLSEYSCSIPTGTTIGKRWKRGEPYCGPRTHWYMGEYQQHPTNPNLVLIVWKEIKIVDSNRALILQRLYGK